MAICSRRILQRLTDENAEFLSRKQVRNQINKLNRNDVAVSHGQEPLLDAEWEVILLNAFSKVGKIEHEPDFGGRRRPDLYFVSSADPGQRFAADITAISDKGFEGQNPYPALWDELMKRAGERGLRQDSFSLQVEGNHSELYKGGPKARLLLPPLSKFDERIFNAGFREFLDKIYAAPGQHHTYPVIKPDERIHLLIGYDPHQKYATGGHLVYKKINHLTENIAYSRLQEKRDQLIGSGFKGPLAVILCDGGFQAFNSKMYDFSAYSMKDVIKRFLLDHSEINFILTFSVEQTSHQVVLGRWASGFFDQGYSGLISCIDRLIEVFPEVESDPSNAINHLKGGEPQVGRSHWGGLSMSPGETRTRVKISARALLDLLAGRVEQKEFFERHHFIRSDLWSGPSINPFSMGLSKGQLIEKLSIERSDSEDDDWVTFELAGPDPAISPFVVPPQAPKTTN
jgi:hypothetical protein